MTLRLERDPGFWARIAAHPDVGPKVLLGGSADFSAVTSPRVTPLAAEHGGYIFVELDGPGRVVELHSLFTPEGWGRETLLALKEAVAWVFASGAQLITTYEVEGNWRSKPPVSFRFLPCGDFAPVEGLPVSIRTWCLPKAAWDASPAKRRM